MAGKKGGRNGNSAIPFEGEKPTYAKRELELERKFNERLTRYAAHYKEATGRDCDIGILIANIVNPALDSDTSFVHKENSGYFNPASENSARQMRPQGAQQT